jgi:hypothetical protein
VSLRPSGLGLEGARNEKGVSFHFCFADKEAGFKPFQTEPYLASSLLVQPKLIILIYILDLNLLKQSSIRIKKSTYMWSATEKTEFCRKNLGDASTNQ